MSLHSLKSRQWLAWLVVLLAFCGPTRLPAQARTPDPETPPGFRLLSEDIGVQLYRKDYSEGAPDFVQVIDMRQGATLKLLHTPVVAEREGRGQYGGADARFGSQSLQQYWKQAEAADKKTFCVVNGLFFYMPDSPTRLALPLKVDGQVLTEGFGYPQYAAEDLLMLELWGDHARIRQSNEPALYTSSAPDILGGLSEEANKRAKYAVARTFIGIQDQDGNRKHETILVFNTTSATQQEAAEVLRSFGAQLVMMLDGGGSTQLLCRDGWYIQSERPIPQAIAIVAGSAPPYQARAMRYPTWPVIMASEETYLEIEFNNRGSQAWQSETEGLLIEKSPWGSDERLPLSQGVEPEENATFTWSTSKFRRAGLYQIEASMTHNSKKFAAEPATFYLVVLPLELEARRAELKTLIGAWLSEPETDVEAQVRTWLQEEGGLKLPEPDSQLSIAGLSLNDVVWIPILMLPFVAALVLIINRIHRRS